MKKGIVIDDNENILENATELQQLSTYQVIAAGNGKIGVVKEETALLAHSISDKSELRSFTADRNTMKYKRKQIIYAEGHHPNRLFYVLKGKVKTFKTNKNGKELVMDLFCPGDFLGHFALLEGVKYRDTAQCLEETELAMIPKEDFDDLLKENWEFANKFIKLLAGNIAEKESNLLRMAYNSLQKRVAEAILLLQKKFQGEDEQFSIHVGRHSLAAIAGTATISLTRTLSELKKEKLIDLKNGIITILNQKKLEQLIN